MLDLEGELYIAPFLELNVTIRKHFKYNLSKEGNDFLSVLRGCEVKKVGEVSWFWMTTQESEFLGIKVSQ